MEKRGKPAKQTDSLGALWLIRKLTSGSVGFDRSMNVWKMLTRQFSPSNTATNAIIWIRKIRTSL